MGGRTPQRGRHWPGGVVLAAVLVAAAVPLAEQALSASRRAEAATAQGYWLVSGDGAVFAHGEAAFHGSAGEARLNRPVVGLAATPGGAGYWLAAADGGIFAFGDAPFLGSAAGTDLGHPVVGIAATPTGSGYWLLTADGGVFAFGDAPYLGSPSASSPGRRAAVALTPTPSGRGYWIAATDGDVVAYGDAEAYGPATTRPPSAPPVVALASTPAGRGYWLVDADGTVEPFGDAASFGDAAGHRSTGGRPAARTTGLVPSPGGQGYWLIAASGEVLPFGDARPLGGPRGQRVVGAAGLLPPAPAPTPPEPPSPPAGDGAAPNVLVVMMDDQRATETLDVMPATRRWFAEAGTTFRSGFANTPLCCPARSTTFSGRYQHNHHVDTNQSGENLDQASTIQRYLHDAAYHTALAGKFLLHWKGPLPHFDHFAHTNGGYEDAYFNVDDRDGHDLGVGETRAEYSTDFIAERALDYLDHFEADDDRPWFLYLAPQAPHGDFTPARRHADAPVPDWDPSPGVTDDYSSAQKADKAPFLRNNRYPVDEARFVRRQQLRTLLAADELVDGVFRRLEAQGELDDTLALFVSDNGAFWAEHGLRSKSLPYTESVHIPFLARWPGRFPAGAIDDRLVGLVDVAPTVLDAAGLSPALVHPLDGRSFLPAEPGRAEILLEYAADPGFDYPAWASLRGSAWQYVEYYDDDGTTVGFREYYDLTADPYQLENVLADGDPANDPDVTQLGRRLAEVRRCSGTAPGGSACP